MARHSSQILPRKGKRSEKKGSLWERKNKGGKKMFSRASCLSHGYRGTSERGRGS